MVLAVSTAAAMHGRLALGWWRAVALTGAFAGALVLLGAPPWFATTAVATGLAAAALIARCSSRGTVLSAGAWTGLAASVAALGSLTVLPAVAAVREAVAAAIGSALGAPLMLVAGPAAEWLFGHATRLTIAEWLSYDRPLLLALAARAPGTFQHSINVAVLADAGARAIGADALMARVGGLYHDVGKQRAPDFFVENQQGANPHDDLDPHESAKILAAHVTDGVDLVLHEGMGERVAAFVREHHGTSSMRLFAAKAKANGAPDAEGSTFRYPGPRPRSRETAILMMADQLEATARSTPPGDAAACTALVRETMARIDGEGQLEESGLTRDDRRRLEPALSRALLAMHHRRLTYPPADAGSRPSRPVPLLPRRLARGRGRA
jgi:putative nucleotidyltransferase with HDIG domain